MRTTERIIYGPFRMIGKPFGVERYHIPTREDISGVILPLSNFLREARHEVHIVTAEMSAELYGNAIIANTIVELVKRGIRVEIICGRNADNETLRTLASKGASVSQTPGDIDHDFWIIDQESILDQDPRAPLEESRTFYLFSKGGFLTRTLHSEFGRLKQVALAKGIQSNGSRAENNEEIDAS